MLWRGLYYSPLRGPRTPPYPTEYECLEEGQLNVSGGAGDRVVVVTAHLPSTPSRQSML